MTLSLSNFVVESMAISMVNDPVSLLSDIAVHRTFLGLPSITAEDLAGFARAIDPKADMMKSPAHVEKLRDVLLQASVAAAAMNEKDKAAKAEEPLSSVLKQPVRREARDWVAYLTYRAFHELAPFAVDPMNGIVGRALWLWCMGGSIEKTFLAEWHDQALRFGGVAEVEKKRVLN